MFVLHAHSGQIYSLPLFTVVMKWLVGGYMDDDRAAAMCYEIKTS